MLVLMDVNTTISESMHSTLRFIKPLYTNTEELVWFLDHTEDALPDKIEEEFPGLLFGARQVVTEMREEWDVEPDYLVYMENGKGQGATICGYTESPDHTSPVVNIPF